MNDTEALAAWLIANQDKKGTPDFEKVSAALVELTSSPVNDVERQRLQSRLDDALLAYTKGVSGAKEEVNSLRSQLGLSPIEQSAFVGMVQEPSEAAQPEASQPEAAQPAPNNGGEMDRRIAQAIGAGTGALAAAGSAGQGVLSSIGRSFGEGFQQGAGVSPVEGTPGQKWWQKVVNSTGPTPDVGSSTEAANKYNQLRNQGKISSRADKLYGPRLPGEPAALIDRPAWRRAQQAAPRGLDAISQTFRQIAQTPSVSGALSLARRAAMPLAGWEVGGNLYDVAKALEGGRRQEAILPSLKTAATLGSFAAPEIGIPAYLGLNAYENAVKDPATLRRVEDVARQPGLRFIR